MIIFIYLNKIDQFISYDLITNFLIGNQARNIPLHKKTMTSEVCPYILTNSFICCYICPNQKRGRRVWHFVDVFWLQVFNRIHVFNFVTINRNIPTWGSNTNSIIKCFYTVTSAMSEIPVVYLWSNARAGKLSAANIYYIYLT